MYAKQALLRAAAVSGLSTLARLATGSQLRILCYHGLWVLPGRPYGECLFMPPQQFEARMARLKRSLLKLRGTRPVEDVERDFARLRTAYDRAWDRGY